MANAAKKAADQTSTDNASSLSPASAKKDKNQTSAGNVSSLSPAPANNGGDSASRNGIKRKRYVQDGSDIDSSVDGDGAFAIGEGRSQFKNLKIAGAQDSGYASLVGRGTIIVGAGFVGLFIARELAMKAKEAGIKPNIGIVDIRSEHCGLASGHCHGILTTDEMAQRWLPIAELAKQSWQSIVSTVDNRQALDFKAGGVFKVTDHGAVNQEKAPSWLQKTSEYSLIEDFGAIGQVNPQKLATWLYNQCVALNVEFCFDSTVTAVSSAEESAGFAVLVQNVQDEDQTTEEVQCDNVILAAGPYTTGVFDQLFDKHSLQLANAVQSAHWFHMSASGMADGDQVALRFPRGAESEKRLEDEITMVANADETIKVSGFGAYRTSKSLTPEHARTLAKGKAKELKVLSAKYLNSKAVYLGEKAQVGAAGRAELSFGNGFAPVIDKVPASGLGLSGQKEADKVGGGGVWVCYGFGQHGTMLAPGAARMLVSKMLDESSDGTGELFGIPKDTKPKGTGKGEGKLM